MRPEERRALEHRVEALGPWLAPYARPEQDDDVMIALAEMFNGFPSLRGDAGPAALARVSGAMAALERFPAWAIFAACSDIHRRGYEMTDSRGEVRAERHWPPSDADVCKVVEDVVKVRAEALRGARALLEAPVEEDDRPPLEERRAHVDRVRAELAARAVPPDELERLLATQRSERRAVAARGQARRLAEDYARAGVEPPGGRVTSSLSLLLEMGWTIQEVNARKVLVPPPKRATVPRGETQASEMGS